MYFFIKEIICKYLLIITYIVIGFITFNLQAANRTNSHEIFELSEQLSEKPTFYIQCQLRYAMKCEDLISAFFAKFTVIERVDNNSAMMKVVLSDESLGENVIVHSKWSSSKDLSIVDFPLPNLNLPSQFDSAKKQAELITLLSQGVLLHIRVKVGTGLEEVVISSIKDNDAAPTDSEGTFYTKISLNGQASKNGIGSVNTNGSSGPVTSNSYGNGSIVLNNSTDRTRIFINGNASYEKATQPGAEGETISADNTSASLIILGVYSLTKDKRWNVAVVGVVSTDKGDNLKNGQTLSTGLEYNLVPFRIDQPYEFRVRSFLSRTSDRLVFVNDRGHTSETYDEVSIQLYAYWLLLKDKASLNGHLSADKNLTYSGYYSASANLKFEYQVNHTVSFNVSTRYSFTGKNIRFPGEPDYSNPLATKYLSGYSGGGYYTSVGVSFKLGKGRTKYSQDRRFD